MKVIDKLWFTNVDGCIGIVIIEEDVAGTRKAYIGSAKGFNEEEDTQRILALGNKLPLSILYRLREQLEHSHQNV